MKTKDSRPPLTKALIVGLATALIGTVIGLTPFGMAVEEEMGLQWLFTLRGPQSPPSDVVIVTTDQQSAFDLNVPQEPWKWPRSLHGRLVETLAEQGATVIAFDLFFKEPGASREDEAFAAAIRQAGNVVLFEKMVTPDETTKESRLFIKAQPTTRLAQSAAALAPNPLPAIPYRVNQFWLYDPSPDHTATLPYIAFQAHVLNDLDTLINRLTSINPAFVRQLQEDQADIDGRHPWQVIAKNLREYVRHNPTRIGQDLETLALHANSSRKTPVFLLTTLLEAVSQGDTRYLDFYGPRGTLPTISYSCVLGLCNESKSGAPMMSFMGKAVFVGFSGSIQSEQHDWFHTVFTSKEGEYVNGVEIAATAFANLLENRQVQPLTVAYLSLTLMIWGIVLCLIVQSLLHDHRVQSGIRSGLSYLVMGAGLGGIYIGFAYMMFLWKGTWFPLVIPLLVQLPIGLFGTLFWRYRETSQQRQNIQRALAHYIPGPIAQQLTRDIEQIKTTSELLEGLCLSTDAERYTALAESLPPDKLRAFMNQYYETIFQPVRERDGIVSDVVGDAVLAIWASPTLHRDLRQQVCEAALAIVDAVDDFNVRYPDFPLQTRIGVHGGPMILGNIGAMDHYEYRAVGDMVSVQQLGCFYTVPHKRVAS